MGWNFTLMFVVSLTIVWAFANFSDRVMNWIRRKYYARKHFKLAERYRREL